jgi:hypothetical protein
MCLMPGHAIIEQPAGMGHDVCVHGCETTPPTSPIERAVSRDTSICDFPKTKSVSMPCDVHGVPDCDAKCCEIWKRWQPSDGYMVLKHGK